MARWNKADIPHKGWKSKNELSSSGMIEIEAVSPEAYVKENGRFPIMEINIVR